MSKSEANRFSEILEAELGISDSEVNIKLVDKIQNTYLIEVSTTKTINDQIILELRDQGLHLINYSIPAEDANKAILNIMYVALASIIAMTIFVLIKSD
jgi:predicted transcriptional regulator